MYGNCVKLVGRLKILRNNSSWHGSVLARQSNVKTQSTHRYAPAVAHYSNDTSGNSVTKRQERMGKLRTVLKEYGAVGVVFHTVISLTSLGSCYMIVKSGIDVEKILLYFKIDLSSPTYKAASTMGVAYILHKMFLPVRAFVTITSVPLIVRYLRAKGIMKAVPKQQNK